MRPGAPQFDGATMQAKSVFAQARARKRKIV